ncbi:MAG: copper chaperone PCu(A)C [Betaproteobacteria bacterium]|nr:MAG: copper chaperone PCu(A)C [Betaproteobacteria bacterium]
MSDATSSARLLQRWPGIGRSASVVAFVGFLASAAFDAHALFIVNQPWVKPGTRNTEAYMVLTSTEGATLIGVRSSIAAQVSLGGPGLRGRARKVLPLPAGAAIALRPGADRIVLTGLTRALKPGERVVLTLEVETATGTREGIEVAAEVRSESPLDAERRAHRH